MKSIWILAKANLRKSKGQTATLLLLIILAATLLNIGMALFFGIGSFFNQRAQELNIAHFIAIHPENEALHAQQIDFIRDFSGTDEVEMVSILSSFGGFFFAEDQAPGMIIIADASAQQQMNPPTLIGDSLPLVGNAAYIPHWVFLGGGFAIGDEIQLEFMETELAFTVVGSTEEMMFGSGTFTVWRIYVSSETFLELRARFPDNQSTLLAARVTDGWAALAAAYRAEFLGIPEGRIGENVIGNYDYFYNVVMLPMIPSMAIVIFALILLIVGSIVIRFRISNDIEEKMINIGALKAAGYSSRQIALFIMMQFGFIALAGGIIGILPAQLTLPLVINMLIEPMLVLPWNPSFSLPMTSAALALILGMVLLFAWITTRRIGKLHPIIALRGGIQTHSFKKNPLPLDNTRGSLHFLLAAKQILRNKKQAVMLCIIVCGLAFSTASVLTFHYNINVNLDVFVHTVIGDIPDVNIRLHDAADGAAILEKMTAHPDVNSIFGRELMILQVDEYMVQTVVVEDFAYHEGYSLISGRFPLLHNEIVLDGITLATLDKRVGDWVTIRIGDYAYDYIISGSVQLMGSFVGMMRADGLRQLQPDFAFINFGLYLLGERAETAAFMDAVRADHADIVAHVVSQHGHIDNIVGSMGNLLVALVIAIVFVVSAVVVLVLHLIIKTLIVRRKRELGIQKAFGFTTLQLMLQITLTLSPAIILGAALGTIGSYIGFNPIFVAVMRGMGVAQASLPVPIGWIALASLALILLSIAVSMAIAWRIREISPYALVSE